MKQTAPPPIHRINTTLSVAARRGRRRAIVAGSVLAVAGSLFIWQSLAATNPNLKGDLNNDNKVNISDLSILLSNFNKTGSEADLDGDGKVGITDLSVLLSNFGKTYDGTTPPTPPNPTPPTPEPPATGSRVIAPGISKAIVVDAGRASSQDIADIKDLGAVWVRGWLNCDDASRLSATIKSMKDAGGTYLPSYNCPLNVGVDAFKTKLAADVKALMPLGIHAWEIGNEMNGGWTAQNNYCNNNSTLTFDCAEREYSVRLKAAYEVIHSIDPQGVVIYGGLASWDKTIGPWMQEIMTNPDKPWKFMDAFGYHPYGSTVAESIKSMDTIKSYMEKEPEFAAKPIWITEVGCWTSGLGAQQNTPCNPQTEAAKAAYLKGLFDALKTWNKGTTFEVKAPIAWYILHENGGSPAGFGLKNGGSKLPAYDTFKNYQF